MSIHKLNQERFSCGQASMRSVVKDSDVSYYTVFPSGRYPWYMPRDTTQISVALGTNIISVAFRPEDICRHPWYMTHEHPC